MPDKDFFVKDDSKNFFANDEAPALEKSFFTRIKDRADKFITEHADELTQKKSGILNPNPDENPLISKSFLPEAGDKTNKILDNANVAPSYFNRAATSIYNNMIRPIASPSGILGSVLDMNPPKEPIGMPKISHMGDTGITRDIRVNPEAVAPVTKPTLGLPPAPPEVLNPSPKPSFIAGPGGVARNVPHQVDVGPVSPRIGELNKGTILNREVEGLTTVNPDLIAGTPPKIGHVETPTEKAFSALVPDRYKSKLQSLAAQPQGEGAFYPKENLPYQSPSAPKPLGNVEPIQEPTVQAPAPKQQAEVTPPPIDVSLTPKEAVQRWGWGRNAGRFAAQQVKNQFSDLSDKPELVGKFQNGDRTSRLKDVSNYFDQRFNQLVKAGVLDATDYKQNYLKQLWENSPEEVNAIFKKSGIAKEPGLSKESVFKSYQQGIAAGLTPKYNNLADIAGAFEKEFNGAIRNKELYDYLKAKKILVGDSKLSSPFEWKVDPSQPGAADVTNMLNNYFSKSPEGLNKIANTVTGTKNLVLSQGLPYRTGQVSAHGFNVLSSDIMASGPVKALKNYFAGSVNPQTDVQFMNDNASITKKLIENGMNWTDIEDHSALTGDKVKSLIDKIPGVGAVNQWRRTALEDPLFRVHLPATKLRIALDRYNQLVPKVGDQEALKAAASYANDFAGGVDKTFRNKTYQDLARIGLLAPDWLESRANIAKGLLTGKDGYVKAGARGAAITAAPVVSGIAARGLSGYLNSKPSESTGVNIGSVENKNRDIEPLGTSVEPQRALVQGVTQLSQGNLSFPARYANNKLSPPIQGAEHLGMNVDPYGNPLSGNDRFGRHIGAGSAAMNIGQELTRPFTPSLITALLDYYRGKAPMEEVASKALGLPITYSSKPKTGLKLR